jgi:DNA invertase Pin-like site-specific DNA recombinase
MKAVGYCRVSSVGQKDGDGLDRQAREIQAFADEQLEQGVYVVKYFRESESGTMDFEDRPVFMEMIQFCIDMEVGTIIVEGMDRLAREMRVQEALLIYLVSKNLTLLSARTGENVTEAVSRDPMRKALIQIQGVFAELEKGMLVQKLRKARTQIKLTTGRCEGRKPYGHYDKEREIRDVMVKDWLNGASFTAIARSLNMIGVKTRSGGQWTPTTVSRIVKRERGIE